MHLHKKGVKIHYCGMSLHKPFMLDENGKSILSSFTELRDFFGEIKPSANQNKVPRDVAKQIENWKIKAKATGMPFLDIDRTSFYWHGLRNWQLEGRQHKYDLAKAYAQDPTDSVVIFPRKKGGEVTPNNGGPWDYLEIARQLSPHFTKVYLVGHPSLSALVEGYGNIEVKVSADNADTLKFCAEAKLIITQHSGAVHIGAYVNTPVLLIFNGEPPIKGLFDTLRFRKNLTRKPLKYAFSLDEIEKAAKKFSVVKERA
jgi:ADP-heptose:LPS heptosyltransferase